MENEVVRNQRRCDTQMPCSRMKTRPVSPSGAPLARSCRRPIRKASQAGIVSGRKAAQWNTPTIASAGATGGRPGMPSGVASTSTRTAVMAAGAASRNSSETRTAITPVIALSTVCRTAKEASQIHVARY